MSAKRTIAKGLLALVALSGIIAAPATAAEAPDAPALTVTSLATPTNFTPEDEAGTYAYDLRLANIGAKATNGGDITVTDTLPAGLEVKSVSMMLRTPVGGVFKDYGSSCIIEPAASVIVKCTISEALPESDEPATVFPGEERQITIAVKAPSETQEGETLHNNVKVQGGGAEAEVSSENKASSQPASGGISFMHTAATEADGSPAKTAGSHPFQLVSGFAVNTKPAPAGATAPFVPAGGDIKDIEVPLPAGFSGGSALTAKRCTAKQFSTFKTILLNPTKVFAHNSCPDSSAVGVVLVQQIEGISGIIPVPLYNLVPPPGMPAQFGTQILNLPFYINTEVRPDEGYKVVGHPENLTQAKRLTAASVIIWGNPGDPRHNPLRGSCINEIEAFPITRPGCAPPPDLEERPLLRMPASCGGPLEFLFRFDNWTHPGEFIGADDIGAAMQGCDSLSFFDPELRARPTTNVSDSPSGLDADLEIPQREHEDPKGVGEPDLRDVSVTLPEGLVLNPAGANGLDACTSAQIDLNGRGPAQCPEASRVGTVEVETPLLDHVLPGSVYTATPYDNPFGTLLAIYVTVNDPISGVVVKLAGKAIPDPVTGQLTTTFEQNPQTPFEHFRLKFFGGPAAVLRSPAVCGRYATHWALTPWSAPQSGPPVASADEYQITQSPSGGPCPTSEDQLPFAPTLQAGSVVPIAKDYTPFTIRLSREDGTQELSTVTLSPPPGLLAKLAGVPYCPEASLAAAAAHSGRAEQANPSCPAASRVGSVTAGAGAGPAPYYIDGTAYLSGPYKGAPLSMAIITPAAAGPYDLGTVVSRVALRVDPETAKVTAVSDPIPHILQGIPTDIRSVLVKLDKPEFTFNPTNCNPMQITGQATSVPGKSAGLTDRFQVGECKRLKFAPRLKLNLRGGTKRSDHPALTGTLTYPKGLYANVSRVSVALPHSEFLEQSHIRTICTRVQFAAKTCPKGSIYGHVRATSPIVDYALQGPVYLRSSSNPLPDLVLALHGPPSQPVEVDVVGRIDSVRGGIRVTFENVPDAPVSKAVLKMRGGKKGLLVNSRDICKHQNRAVAKLDAQNGKFSDSKPVLKARCGGKKSNKKHRRFSSKR